MGLTDHTIHVQSLSEQFILLAEDLSQLLHSEGVTLRPFLDKMNLKFSKLPTDYQLLQVNHLRRYVNVCHETKDQGHSLKESGFLLWNMLRELDLTPAHDLFNKIQDEQIFEIYDQNSIQIFRNLNFFKICSYSLDDLLSVPWWKLYRREETMSREIFRYATAVTKGEITETIFPPLPAHLLEEIESESKFKMMIQIKAMSPLKSHEAAIHCFVAEEVKLLEN